MSFLPTFLATEIQDQIFSYIGGEHKYWQDLFQKKVIPQIDPKGYFSRNVLPEIDEGWRLVSLYCSSCDDCYNQGFDISNPNCNDCMKLKPCLNCYWYNLDPYNIGNTCYCSENLTLVSWKEISFGTNQIKKYPKYYNFICGMEWQIYLIQCSLTIQFNNNIL